MLLILVFLISVLLILVLLVLLVLVILVLVILVLVLFVLLDDLVILMLACACAVVGPVGAWETQIGLAGRACLRAA